MGNKGYNSGILYCKSGVAIHPSSNKRDNVMGILICYMSESNHHQYEQHEQRRPSFQSLLESTNRDFNLAWIREDNMSLSMKNQILELELSLSEGYLADSRKNQATEKSHSTNFTSNTMNRTIKDSKHIDTRMLEFKADWYMSINSIYSIQFRAPSQWYKGSIIINPKQTEYTYEVPILFFHDESCESTKLISKKLMLENFDPFTNERNLYWGGDDFKHFLAKNCDLQLATRKNNDNDSSNGTVYLVNASLDDLRSFQSNTETSKLKSLKLSDGKNGSGEGLFEKLEKSKWSILGKFADITNKLTNEDPKINPILQTIYSSETINKIANDKYLKKLLNKSQPQINSISNDFEGAKIYLAKWALSVKEQVEKNENVYKRLTKEMDNMVTEEEVHVALERNHPLTLLKWESMLDDQGRLKYTVSEIKDYIFHGGCVDDAVRVKVWPFLLNVFPWDSSLDEREQLYETLKTIYELNYKNQWVLDQVPDDFSKEVWDEEKFKIKKDVFRNDRHLELYKHNTIDGQPLNVVTMDNGEEVQQEEVDVEEDDNDASWTIKNPHLKNLENILLSYNVYNPKLGYCQGMTDLLSPIYHVLQDEVLSFWSFIEFMNRMERNFSIDQSGIKEQMITLGELTSLMFPDLMAHLSKCDSSNMFFVYKMILILFKRDFEEEKVKQIWEILFTNYYSSQFHLFFILGILQKNKVAIEHLNEFDEILKYFNDLKNLDNVELMTRAELLFIKFKKIISNIDERKLLSITSQNQNPKQTDAISNNLRGLLSKNIITVKSK